MMDAQIGSPRSHYRYTDGMGDVSDEVDGLDDSSEVSLGWRGLPCQQRLAAEAARTIFPWALSMLLGVLTALTGSYIAVNCDFLGDLRFGFCRGVAFADRSRCCGGSENVDLLRERCKAPAASVLGPSGTQGGVEWIPWTEFFGVEDRLESWAGYALSFFIYVVSSVVWTGLGTFLVCEYCPAARGSGIPEVKAAVSGFDLPQSFSGWCLLIKTLGLALVVGAGLSLGKEGPLIHIGVCWAYLLQRGLAHTGLLGEAMPLHELACVGAAAGVSTAFGAPLGGVLFAAEELGSVRSLSRQSLLFAFMAAFSASFTLKYLNLSGANRLTLFALSTSTHNPKKEWIAWEMAAFCLLGLIGGLGGVLFIKLNLHCTVERRRCQQLGRLWMLPESLQAWSARGGAFGGAVARAAALPSLRAVNVAEGMLIAVLTALLNYPLTTLLRTMSVEAIHALFETCPHSRANHFGLCDSGGAATANLSAASCLSLLLAALVRILQTSYTFGASLPSGLFIPSLFIGATLGRLVGNLVLLLVELEIGSGFKVHIEPGMFAIVGAVATLSGFCRMTVSLVVIMLELTGELTYVVPFMCAVLTAKLVGDSLTPSIYDCHAKLNGYAPIEEQRDIRLGMVVGDLAVPIPQEDWIDASAPMPLHAVERLARPACGGSSEAPAFGLDEGRRQHHPDSGALLVVRPAWGTAASSNAVVGVVDRAQLRRWLARHAGKLGAELLAFSPPGSEPSSVCAGAPLPRTPQGLASDGAMALEAPGSSSHRSDVLDASGLVDTRIARLLLQAPLLTAYCAFKQKPRLQHCVCCDERQIGSFSLLSREDFDAALGEQRFALSHAPDPAASGLRRRPTGTAAVVEMLGPSWRRWLGGLDQQPDEGGEPDAAAAGRSGGFELAPLAGSLPEGGPGWAAAGSGQVPDRGRASGD